MRSLPEILAEFKSKLPRAGFAAIVVISATNFNLVFWPSDEVVDLSREEGLLAELGGHCSNGGIPIAFFIAESVLGAHRFELFILEEFKKEKGIRDFLRGFVERYETHLQKIGVSILRPELN
jgi:hypothetical protein